MDMYDALKSGMTPDQLREELEKSINAAQEKIKEEEEAQLKINEEASRIEELKREARTSIINGCLAYIEAFDLNEGEEVTEEDINSIEELLIKFEDAIPKYVQMFKMMEDFRDTFGE